MEGAQGRQAEVASSGIYVPDVGVIVRLVRRSEVPGGVLDRVDTREDVIREDITGCSIGERRRPLAATRTHVPDAAGALGDDVIGEDQAGEGPRTTIVEEQGGCEAGRRRHRVVNYRDIGREADDLERRPQAGLTRHAENQVVVDGNTRGRIADGVAARRAGDGDGGRGVAQQVIADRHVGRLGPGCRPTVVRRGKAEDGADLRARPGVLQHVVLEEHALRVLQVDDVRHPRLCEPRDRLREVVTLDVDVGRDEVGNGRVGTAQHNVLPGRLQIGVVDAQGPGRVRRDDGLGVGRAVHEVREIGVDDRAVREVELDASSHVVLAVAVDVTPVHDNMMRLIR